MLKSLLLISLLFLLSCGGDSRPFVKITIKGTMSNSWASSSSWRPQRYSIGIIMDNNESMLLETDIYSKEENYKEARRLYKTHSIGDKVIANWYIRQEIKTTYE